MSLATNPRPLTRLLSLALILPFLLAPAALAQSGDPTSFSAQLSGAAEVPPVETDATGTVTAELNGTELTVSGTFSGLESDFDTSIGAHIHGGAPGENGPVRFALDPTLDADLRGGSFEAAANVFTLTEAQVDSLTAGLLYVNVHTEAHPGGEIRGQLVVPLDLTFSAELTGEAEVPDVETDASGIVSATLLGNQLIVSGAFDGLESAFNTDVGAHIHAGAPGVNGPVRFALEPELDANLLGGAFEAEANTFTLTEAQVDSLIAGLFYVNVHTVVNPSGEIRGQLVLPIAEARELGVGTTVGVRGTVTRSKGDFTYFQDATGGLTIRQTSGAFADSVASGGIALGTELVVSGTLSEFRQLLQINEDDLDAFDAVGMGDVPEPQVVTLAEILANGEQYEGELVTVLGLETEASGTFEAGTSYTVTDASTEGSLVLRVPNASDTDLVGMMIPDSTFTFTGVLGQFDFSDPAAGYQLLAIAEGDVAAATARLQVIHNAPDPAFTEVDVYVNGELLLDDLAFRDATPFLDVAAVTELVVAVAPGDSDSADDAVHVDTLSLDAYGAYQLAALGLSDPDAFAANPDGADTSFMLLVNAEAKETSPGEGFVDVNAIHGTPDAPTIDIVEATTGTVLSDDLAYGELKAYATLPVGAYALNVTAADDNDEVLAAFAVDLAAFDGLAGTVLASGFLDPDANQNGAEFGLLGVLPDGETVFFEPLGVSNEGGTTTPAAFALGGTYPNPATASATLRYDLPADAEVRLVVYDVLGREVMRAAQPAAAGAGRTMALDTGALPAGTYLYRLTAEMASETQSATGRMTVVR